ncbi:DUF2946 family protein [Solimonas sp. K1W22B-7]|nr:DUF2946 family protein [Solimonas sp. K1W22B-7]
MEDWVLRALARWPDVPALFGWLSLDRRGRWLIRGEPISRPQILDTISRNYGADEYGRWYFQNGPQRGYIRLDTAPYVLWSCEDAGLQLHTGQRVRQPSKAFIDEEGSILLLTEYGPAALSDNELDWALARLGSAAGPVDEEQLAAALALPSGQTTALSLHLAEANLPLQRLDRVKAPKLLGFVREPQPRAGEKFAAADSPEP